MQTDAPVAIGTGGNLTLRGDAVTATGESVAEKIEIQTVKISSHFSLSRNHWLNDQENIHDKKYHSAFGWNRQCSR